MANIVNAGYVFKDDGTAVSGATVSVLQADTSTSVATGTTNSSGYYAITTTTENANAYDVKIESGASVRYRRGKDRVQMMELDIRNNTANTQGGLLVANNTNNASNKIATFANRSRTGADNDEIYVSFEMMNDADEIHEFARITAEQNDASNGSEDGEIRFAVADGSNSGALTEVFVMSSAVGGGTAFDITTSTVSMATDSFTIKSEDDGSAAIFYMEADQGDDNADKWRIQVADGGTMTWASYIGGSYGTHITVTPNSTASSSNVSVAGSLTLGNVAAAGTDTDKFLVLDGSGNVDYRTGTQVLSDIGAGTGSGDITGVTITADDTNTASDTAGSADFTVAGGSGLTSSVSGTTITVAGDDASTSAKGVAQFSSDNFAASSGTITIKDGGVVTAEIAADAITGAKIADDAIGSEHIADDAVVSAAIADGAVTTALIGADAVTSAKIPDDAISEEHLADDVISAQTEITSGLVAADELLYSDGGVLKKVGLDNFVELSPQLATEDTIAVASDYVLFLDGGGTGNMNKESIADFVSAIAGSGLSASSGQLTASGGVSTGKAIAFSLIF